MFQMGVIKQKNHQPEVFISDKTKNLNLNSNPPSGSDQRVL